MSDSEKHQRSSDWLSANVIVAIMCFLVAQFATSIWWASKITAQIGFIQATIEERTGDRYRAVDAAKDFASRDQLIISNVKRIDKVEDMILKLEQRSRHE